MRKPVFHEIHEGQVQGHSLNSNHLNNRFRVENPISKFKISQPLGIQKYDNDHFRKSRLI